MVDSDLPKTRLLPWMALLTVWVAWGSTYLGIHVAVETIPPLLMAGTRFVIAALILLAVFGPRHATGENRPTKPQARSAAVVGLLMLLGGNGLLCIGELHLASGTAAVLVATVPIWMVLINAVVTRTRVPRALIAALATGLVGITILVAGPSGSIGIAAPALVLFASLLWAAGSVYGRTAPLPKHPMIASSCEMLAGGVGCIIAGIARGELSQLKFSAMTAASLGGLAWLVVAGSIVGFTAYLYANRTLPNDILATYAYVNPIIAVLLGTMIGSEALSLNVLIGGAIVIGSVAVVIVGRSGQARKQEEESAVGESAMAEAAVSGVAPQQAAAQ